ncbi:hypothetical protein [Lysobacter sp. Hz 25]|uniref:hypothetical protein n=1 Tax=Lysobacter sp. Hz 25 TaxID=3383698 RepID=UPI0038D353FC
MSRGLVAVVFALALLMVQGGCAASRDYMSLTLPHAPKPGERAFLEVELDALPTGHEVEVSLDTGRRLGVISPHGIRPGRGAGTYTLPLPADAVRDAPLRVRIRITRADAAPREASADEVRGVRVILSGDQGP